MRDREEQSGGKSSWRGKKTGEPADCNEEEDRGVAGVGGAALGQDVVLQGFMEEQLQAQE